MKVIVSGSLIKSNLSFNVYFPSEAKNNIISILSLREELLGLGSALGIFPLLRAFLMTILCLPGAWPFYKNHSL